MDLLFPWCAKFIKLRAAYEKRLNELLLYAEYDNALVEYLDEQDYKKYGGEQNLVYFLRHFIGDNRSGSLTTVRAVMDSTGWCSRKTHRLIVQAREDGFLLQNGNHGSHYLTEKGREAAWGPYDPLGLYEPSEIELSLDLDI